MFRNLNKPDATVARRVAIPVLCVDVNNSENPPYGARISENVGFAE